MFNSDFYPTPSHVVEQMLSGLDLFGKTVLEPSAGSGNIIDALKELGSQVICCENHEKLSIIAGSKARLIASDFLTVLPEQVSHISCIIMNPPFSRDEAHILHAWSIAPEGAVIRALCNSNTIQNKYSRSRKELGSIIDLYGFAEDLGNAFSSAERQTEVEVTMITLFKPKTGENEFDGYFSTEEEERGEVEGIVKYDLLREIVERYVASVKMFDEVLASNQKINSTANIFSNFNNISFGATRRTSHGNHESVDRETYKKELQKSAWKLVLSYFELDRFVTKKVKDDINKFVETQTQVPFTLKNIYKMADMIFQTRGQNMDKALIDVFDRLTQHYHDNRYGVEGWKTNSHYLLNQKIIAPYLIEATYEGKVGARYGTSFVENIDDLLKSLCYLTGKTYSNEMSLYYYLGELKPEFGQWFDWVCRVRDKEGRQIETFTFFECKAFKKGTMHMKFKNESIWALLNQRICKIKGFPLPESLKKK